MEYAVAKLSATEGYPAIQPVVHFGDQEILYPECADDAVPRRLPIFHVHGFIPRDEYRKPAATHDVVFSRDEYFLNMLRPHSWQTTTQVHYLRSYNCLFIGASLSDINMTRLLSYSNDDGKRRGRWTLMAKASIIDPSSERATDHEVPGTVSDAAAHCAAITARALSAALRIKATILERLGISLIISGSEYETVATAVRCLANDIEPNPDIGGANEQAAD